MTTQSQPGAQSARPPYDGSVPPAPAAHRSTPHALGGIWLAAALGYLIGALAHGSIAMAPRDAVGAALAASLLVGGAAWELITWRRRATTATLAWRRLLAEHAALAARVQQQEAAAEAAAAALQEARAAAEAAGRLSAEFLALVSHELRTPLNAIVNFSRLIGKPRYGPLNTDQRQLQEWILYNARHLTQIINDILDFAKIDSEHAEPASVPTDVAALLQECLGTATILVADKPVALRLTLPEQGCAPLLTDPTRVRQVVLNLLSNAVKFTAAGHIHLTVHDTPAACTVVISDTGIGIAAADLERIFEPFQQVQRDMARQYEGVGLGLAISRRLVERHGGRLWVSSTPGRGATFCFTLPRTAAPQGTLADGAAPPDAPLVVVVDDNAGAQAIFRAYLIAAGYRCISVQDSRDAHAALRAYRPIGVLLDVSMPGLNGWEVLAALRSDPATAAIPVAMCSIEDQPPAATLRHQPDAYLVKPVDEAALLAQVQRWAASARHPFAPNIDPS